MSLNTPEFIEQAITNASNDFAKVINEVAKGFRNRGFFEDPNWKSVLLNNFIKHETAQGVHVYLDEIQLDIYNSVRVEMNNNDNQPKNDGENTKVEEQEINCSLILPILKVHTSTPISSMNRVNDVRGKDILKVPINFLQKMKRLSWTEICRTENENKKVAVNKVTPSVKKVSTKNQIITNGGRELHNDLPAVEASTELPNVQISQTIKNEEKNTNHLIFEPTNQVPGNKLQDNGCNEKIAQELGTEKPQTLKRTHSTEDADSDDDNLLIPLKVRTPSPHVKSVLKRTKSMECNVKIKVENNIETPNQERLKGYKETLKYLTGVNWSLLCSDSNKKAANTQYGSPFNNGSIMTHIHSAVPVNKEEVATKQRHSSQKMKTNENIGYNEQQDSRKNEKTQFKISHTNKCVFDWTKSTNVEHFDADGTPSKEPALNVLPIITTRRVTRLQTKLALARPEVISTGQGNKVSSIRGPSLSVMFTAVDSQPYMEILNQLNLTVATMKSDYDVLVTDSVFRSTKFLCALGSGKPIVSVEWLNALQSSKLRLDPYKFLLKDESGEQKYNFCLPKTIEAAGKKLLFNSHSILVTPSTNPSPDVLKDVITSCGGKYLKTTLKPRKGDTVICVSDMKDHKKWQALRSKYKDLKDIIHVNGFAQAIFQYNLDVSPYRLDD